MNESKRDEMLVQMAADLAEIKTKLNADFRALHGNGHPGLLEKHERLEDRVLKLEELHRSMDKSKQSMWAWIGLLATAAGTVVALIRK